MGELRCYVCKKCKAVVEIKTINKVIEQGYLCDECFEKQKIISATGKGYVLEEKV